MKTRKLLLIVLIMRWSCLVTLSLGSVVLHLVFYDVTCSWYSSSESLPYPKPLIP